MALPASKACCSDHVNGNGYWSAYVCPSHLLDRGEAVVSFASFIRYTITNLPKKAVGKAAASTIL
jgi:hypothetical protein